MDFSLERLVGMCFDECAEISTSLNATVWDALQTNAQLVGQIAVAADKINSNLYQVNYGVQENRVYLQIILGVVCFLAGLQAAMAGRLIYQHVTRKVRVDENVCC
jgi:hypothetical protein